MENPGLKGYIKGIFGTCLCAVGFAFISVGYYTTNPAEKTAYNLLACASIVVGTTLTYYALKKEESVESVGPDMLANDITYIPVNEENATKKQEVNSMSQ